MDTLEQNETAAEAKQRRSKAETEHPGSVSTYRQLKIRHFYEKEAADCAGCKPTQSDAERLQCIAEQARRRQIDFHADGAVEQHPKPVIPGMHSSNLVLPGPPVQSSAVAFAKGQKEPKPLVGRPTKDISEEERARKAERRKEERKQQKSFETWHSQEDVSHGEVESELNACAAWWNAICLPYSVY